VLKICAASSPLFSRFCCAASATDASFPPVAKGGLGGVVSAKPITALQTISGLQTDFLVCSPPYLLSGTDTRGSRSRCRRRASPHPLSKGGKELAVRDGPPPPLAGDRSRREQLSAKAKSLMIANVFFFALARKRSLRPRAHPSITVPARSAHAAIIPSERGGQAGAIF
jgi:hypothetical protein